MKINQKTALTLVETLVVIAIIGVITSIIVLPLISRVRQRAQSAQCQSNLRSWITALHLYVPEHGGILPPSKWTSGSSSDATTFLWPYLNAASKSDAWERYFCPVKTTEGNQKWGTYGFNSLVSESPMAPLDGPRLIYAMDLAGGSRWIGGLVWGGSPSALATAAPKPHMGKINAAYLDGHVISTYVSELVRADFTRSTNSHSESYEKMPLASPDYDY